MSYGDYNRISCVTLKFCGSLSFKLAIKRWKLARWVRLDEGQDPSLSDTIPPVTRPPLWMTCLFCFWFGLNVFNVITAQYLCPHKSHGSYWVSSWKNKIAQIKISFFNVLQYVSWLKPFNYKETFHLLQFGSILCFTQLLYVWKMIPMSERWTMTHSFI